MPISGASWKWFLELLFGGLMKLVDNCFEELFSEFLIKNTLRKFIFYFFFLRTILIVWYEIYHCQQEHLKTIPSGPRVGQVIFSATNETMSSMVKYTGILMTELLVAGMGYTAVDSWFCLFKRVPVCSICYWFPIWCLSSICRWSWENSSCCRWKGIRETKLLWFPIFL